MLRSEAELNNRIRMFLLRKEEEFPKIFNSEKVNLNIFRTKHIKVRLA